MNIKNKFRSMTALESAARICAVTTVVVAAVSFLSWVFAPGPMLSLTSYRVVMAPVTALCFSLLGGALFVYTVKRVSRSCSFCSMVAAGLVGLIAAAELLNYLTGIEIIPDNVLPRTDEIVNGFPAGAVSPDTAATLLLSSIALLSLTLPARWSGWKNVTVAMALIAGLNGTAIAMGYLYGAPFFHDKQTSPMSAVSAFVFMIVNAGLVAAAGDKYWPLRLVTGPTTRARLLRAYLPLIVMIGVAQDLLSSVLPRWITGINPVLIQFLLGLLLLVLISLTILRLSSSLGSSIDRAEMEREKAEEALRNSEEQHRLLLQGVDEIVYMVEDVDEYLNGRLVYISDQVGRITGHKPREFLSGQNLWMDLLHPDDITSISKDSRKIHAGRKGGTRSYRLRDDRTGQYRWLEDRVVPRLDKSGNVIGSFGVARDVTEHHQAEEALRESEERYRTLAENAQDAIFIIDREDIVRYVNDFAAKMMGMPVSQITGKPRAKLFPREIAERQGVNLKKVFQKGQPLSIESMMEYQGRQLWQSTQLVPLVLADGSVGRVLGIARDISERKHLEQQLVEAQKMEAIGLLAGGIAHDFNNLLMVIQGNAELELTGLDESAPMRETLTTIIDTSRRAASLVQQLLAFSRRQILNPTTIDVKEMMDDLASLIPRVIEENIDLTIDVPDEVGYIYADRSTLEQVIMNLTVNARDAMPEGGEFRIEGESIELDEAACQLNNEAHPGKYVRLSFVDSGMGIDAEIIKHIFEPFFTSKSEGTGLGLSIVYGIVKQQGGFLTVASRPGQGTRFEVFLPSYEPEEPAPIKSQISNTAVTGSETILVAEDEENVRELLRIYLKEMGYTVLLAGNGAEALEIFTRDPDKVDLVVMDSVMPVMSGPQAYERMVQVKPGQPCLFVSGYSEEISRRHFGDGLNVTLLRKPVSSRDLGVKVRELLG